MCDLSVLHESFVRLELPLQRCHHLLIGVHANDLRWVAIHLDEDLDLLLWLLPPLLLSLLLLA